MSDRAMRYTGSRRDEYETAKIFYKGNKPALKDAIKDLNRREIKARKQAERREKKAIEAAIKAEAARKAAEKAKREAKKAAAIAKKAEREKLALEREAADKREYAVSATFITNGTKQNKDGEIYPVRIVVQRSSVIVGLKAAQRWFEQQVVGIEAGYMTESQFISATTTVKDKKIELIKRQTKDKKSIKMKSATALDLDGQVLQTWDSGNGTCVFDFLIWRYGEKKGCVKTCNMDTLKMLFSKWMENGTELFDYTSDINGVCVYQCEAFCNAVGINMYALDENDLIMHTFQPAHLNKNLPPLVFKVKNNHFYAIMDQSKSICMRGKNTSGMEYKIKSEEKEEKVYDIQVMPNNGADIGTMIRIMKNKKKEVYPSRNIQMGDGGLMSFILDGVKYVSAQSEELQAAKKIAEINDNVYNGESTFNILINTLEAQNYKEKSVCNPHLHKSLLAENVKFRTHYGVIGEYTRNDLQSMIDDGSAICADIAKCYTACIENPFDEFIQYEFNDEWEAFDGKLKTGLYYVSTNDMTLFHGSNIYSNKIIELAQQEQIEFTIEAQAIPSKTLKRDYFHNLLKEIDRICKGDKDLKKSLTNIITGFLGKHQSKKYFPKLTTDIETVWSDFNTEPFHNNETFMYKYDDYYLYGYVQPVQYSETNVPMYIQILDWSNIRLYNMIKQAGGRCAFRKTDCAVIIGGSLQYGSKNGEYRVSPLPEKCGKMRLPEDRSVDKSIVFDGEWNKHTEIYTSNQIEEVYALLMQQKAINNVSRAGTGKTYNALAVEKLFVERNQNAKVIKLAFTNKACLNFGGTTIHKFLKIDKDGKFNTKWLSAFRNQSVLFIIDEISMIGEFLWRRLVELKKHMDAYFMLLGDYRQVPPVEEGKSTDYFNSAAMKFMANYQQIEFTERQRYDEDLWNFAEDVYERDINDMSKVKTANKFEYSLLLKATNICYYNSTRKYVNKVLNEFAAKGKETYTIEFQSDNEKAKQQTAILYAGLPIISIRNNRKLEIVNNETFTIQSVDEESMVATNMRVVDGVETPFAVKIPTAEFHNYFMLNYCSTTHCQQGATINNDIIIFDYDCMSKELRYTALTRAKKLSQIHIRV